MSKRCAAGDSAAALPSARSFLTRARLCVPPPAPCLTPVQDPKGTLSRGRRMYGALFASLRLLTAITGMHPRVTVHSIVYNAAQKEVDVRLTMAFGEALVGEPVRLACMSHYKVHTAKPCTCTIAPMAVSLVSQQCRCFSTVCL
jgi:hypothetical protein